MFFRWTSLPLLALVCSQPALSNDWQKFYRELPGASQTLPADGPPESIPSAGSLEKDLELMWRRGFVPIGFTEFETGNSKSRDGERLAKKIGARYFIIGIQLTSSRTASIPLTLPNSTTTVSSGNVQAYGSSGSATGSYSGTSTTYGSETTYIPVEVNRYAKMAVYFREAPKIGTGIYARDLTPDEIKLHETRRAFAVRFVRDASPAYQADILPGDVILRVNGQAAESARWQAALQGPQPMKVELYRNGAMREIELTVSADWKQP